MRIYYESVVLVVRYMHMCKMHFLSFWHAALRRPRVLTRDFGCGASKRAESTFRRMSGSRPNTVAVLGVSDVAELALKNEGLLSASPRRAGDMENLTMIIFLKSIAYHPRTLFQVFSAEHMFYTPGEEVAVAAADINWQQQYTTFGRRICCTKPIDG